MIRAADLSMTAEVESLGGRYFADGREVDLFEWCAASGLTAVRLRLWFDPRDQGGRSYQGGGNDLATTLALARRAHAAGLDLLLDLHYSDFWTDPKKQQLPKAWLGLSHAEVCAAVHRCTADVLAALLDQGTPAGWVQVGNEITNGMLWPHGQIPRYDFEARTFEGEDPLAWDRLADLLHAGLDAVPEQVGRILHLDFGGAGDLYRGWFDQATARDLDFDIIGLSYYPFWHGTLADLGANLTDLVDRYDKDVLVVETSYAWTAASPPGHHQVFSADLAEVGGYPASPAGQSAFLTDLAATIAAVPGGRGLGLVYWEPAWLPVPGTSWASPAGMAYAEDVAEPGNPWANQALFDFDGNALDGWRALGGG